MCNETFRWRNDDGTEASATWRAAKDEFTLGIKTQQTVRIRFCVYPSTVYDGSGQPVTNWLVYSEGPNYVGTVRVPAMATTQAFEMAASPWLSSPQPTTAQLPSGTKTAFLAGWALGYPQTETPVITFTSTNQYSNVEFCIRPTTNARPGKTYKLFATGNLPVDLSSTKAAYLMMGKPGDVNGDDLVNVDDLNDVVSNFGRSYK
jgi:hypothetical protein